VNAATLQLQNPGNAPNDALSLLRAEAPWAEYSESLMTYGRFVGSWSVESTWYKSSGERIRMDGEWHFSWILGGRGIIDVLYGAGFTPDRYGTTLRYYDSDKDLWHCTWMQPGVNEFTQLVAWKSGDDIVQEIQGLQDRREIWRFTEICQDSFLWRTEVSRNGGASWFVEQEIRAKKRRTA